MIFLRPFLPYILMALCGLGAVGFFYQRGVSAERARVARHVAEENNKNREARDAIDRDTARVTDPAAELRRDWQR